MNRFVIGDIHGNYKALLSVISKSGIKYSDKLIILGDVVDGHSRTYECVEELLKFKNRIFVLGNHDQWFINWYSKEWRPTPDVWAHQGGQATINSYKEKVKKTHRDFFSNHKLYYEEDNMLFLHGGLGKSDSPRSCEEDTILWDREMVYRAKEHPIGNYDKIFVGHTTTQLFGTTKPLKHNNVWMVDTGGGYDGKLTLMNIDTEEYWQG